jgi:DNA-binding transcriptional LysR family regulator
MQTISDLNDLRFVAMVAKLGNLSHAARELKVNHATVFRRIENIETRIGVRLFDRHAGHYQATPAGEELARAGEMIENEATESLRRVAGHDIRPSGLVRITATDDMAAVFMGNIVHACYAQYPDIQLHIITSTEALNLSKRDADIALRAAVHPPEHLIGKTISPIGLAIYASKSYIAQAHNLLDLEAQQWIVLEDNNLHPNHALKRIKKNIPEHKIQLRINSVMGVQQACLAGIGLAVLPCFVGDSQPQLERHYSRASGVWRDKRRA